MRKVLLLAFFYISEKQQKKKFHLKIMKKFIVAGGRDFADYTYLSKNCLDIIDEGDEIVSGGARGADLLGERFAKENGISIKRFPANWNLHGKSAGPIRNKQMAQYADGLICFWDGESRGTKNMIDEATSRGLEIHIFNY
jgi:hypothetical protein